MLYKTTYKGNTKNSILGVFFISIFISSSLLLFQLNTTGSKSFNILPKLK